MTFNKSIDEDCASVKLSVLPSNETTFEPPMQPRYIEDEPVPVV